MQKIYSTIISMNKLLLACSALTLSAFAMSAAEYSGPEGWELVSPMGYPNFGAVSENILANKTVISPNIVPGNHATYNANWTNEDGAVWIIGNNGSQNLLSGANGYNIVDLGKEARNVIAVAGNTAATAVNATLAKYDLPALKAMNACAPYGGIAFSFNNTTMTSAPKSGTYRLTFIYNIYKDPSLTDAPIGTVNLGNSQIRNKITLPALTGEHNLGPCAGSNVSESVAEGEWNPEKFAVLQYEFPVADWGAGPFFFELQTKNGGVWNKIAYFIQTLKLEYKAAAANGASTVHEPMKFAIGSSVSTGVENIVAPEALEVSIDGNEAFFGTAATVYSVAGVQVAQVAAGARISLNPGVYVAVNAAGARTKFGIK